MTTWLPIRRYNFIRRTPSQAAVEHVVCTSREDWHHEVRDVLQVVLEIRIEISDGIGTVLSSSPVCTAAPRPLFPGCRITKAPFSCAIYAVRSVEPSSTAMAPSLQLGTRTRAMRSSSLPMIVSSSLARTTTASSITDAPGQRRP